VRQDNTNKHPQYVLNREKPDSRIPHCGAKISQRDGGGWTQEKVQDDPNQHLHIQQDGIPEPRAVIHLHPATPERYTRYGSNNGKQGSQHNQPPKNGMQRVENTVQRHVLPSLIQFQCASIVKPEPGQSPVIG
jgi:hypothetical protein